MSAPYYWEKHLKYAVKGRIGWYAECADPQFWTNHWMSRLSKDMYADTARLDMRKNLLGTLLLKELKSDGIHLEAGCGIGYWVSVLCHKGLRVEGIETAQDLVPLVNSVNPNLPVRYGDALAIDCPANYYDTYLSFGVVEHRQQGPEPFLLEANRVLKPGGKMIISVPYFGMLRQLKNKLALYKRKEPALPFFQYGFTEKEFLRLIRQAGFTIKTCIFLEPHRLLLEEISFYRWLIHQRGGRYVKKIAEILMSGRDGHMLLVIGEKS